MAEFVEREVKSDDPDLSPKANCILTEELREVVGTDRVELPAEREPTDAAPTPGALLAANRALIIVTFLAAVVLGGIVGLTTGSWWALIVAVCLHALGTMFVAVGAIRMTTEVEHVSPNRAPLLEAEGVADPDEKLTELVQDYASARPRGEREVLAPGFNERTADADASPQDATAEQASAVTPTGGEGSQPGGGRSAVELPPWWFALGMVAASVVIAAVVGGRMWVLPLVIGAVGGGWLLLQDRMTRGRRPDERGFRWKVAGVAIGIALVAAAGVGLLVFIATAI
jgi:Flp pilus assembly protein TadB